MMKTSKKLLCLLSLVVMAYFLVIGSVNAENQVGIVNYNSGEPFLEAQIANDTYYGVCLDHDKKYPKDTVYTITNSSGNTSDHVKNIIIKYYRENNTDRYNFLIQYTVWSSIGGRPMVFADMTEEEVGICLQMYNYQTGVVGNTYTDENGIKHIFTFKYGTPLTDTTRQNALFFSYVTETEESQNMIRVNPNNPSDLNDFSNLNDFIDPGDLNDHNQTPVPKESKKQSKPQNIETPADSSEPKNHGTANMKTTGISTIAILLVLLSNLCFVIRKK